MTGTQEFQLEELRIDPKAGEVVGPGGREQLDPKVMGVLEFMARHAGRVVSRDELLAQLWPNAVVTDDALTRCFYELRRHLSQAGGSERYKTMLETLPKRGYRLNATISRPPSRPEARPQPVSRRRWVAPAIGLVVAAALLIPISRRFAHPPPPPQSSSVAAALSLSTAARSIAVLPFVDMSAGQDQAWFADGISEEILNRLAQSGSLRVIARTSSFSFRNRPVDIPEIAARLGVTHVLEGSVRRAGDRVRITAQLIAAADSSHVWSETIERKFGDLFAVQDEIAASVATALDAALVVRPARGEAPVNPATHESFLQGEFFYNRRAPGDIQRAVKYYEEAVEIEPKYARAWAALAGAYALLADLGGPTSGDWTTRQNEAAHKAVEFGPELAVAHARLGQYYFRTGDRERGEALFQKALALDPDDALVAGFAVSDAIRRGDPEAALSIQRKLAARDPLSVTQRGNFGTLLFVTGRLDEALAEYRMALELSPQGGWEREFDAVCVLVALRRYDDAYRAIERLPTGKRDFGLALLHEAPGHRAEADAALSRLSARSARVSDIRLADVYAFRGMRDAAFAALKRAQEAISREGSATLERARAWDFHEELRVSPFLNPLRSDARWAALTADPP